MDSSKRFPLQPAVLAAILWAARLASAGPDELVHLERNFAEAVAANGVRRGFEQYLAEDAVMLRPQPMNRADFLGRADDPGLLEWAPAYARLAKSGDLGFTYGPWRYRSARTNATIAATGQYLTVWRGTADGWRAAIDAGLGSPAVAYPPPVETDGPDEPDEPLPDWQHTQRGQDLKYIEETFERRSARDGESRALDIHGHKRVRVLRQGVLPIVGRGDAVSFLAFNRRLSRDSLRGLQVSGAGDLGYAWGESELIGEQGPTPTTVRSWVRVWRRSGWSGTWRVALDLAVDYPPETARK